MTNYTVEFTSLARKQLQKLPRKASERIVAAIDQLLQNPRPNGSIKLKSRNAYRIRVGDSAPSVSLAELVRC